MVFFGTKKPKTLFGGSLDKFTDVPDILRQLCDHIDETSADVEGLFRKPGNGAKVKEICQLYETQSVVNLNDPELSPHTLCSVIKKFLKDLKGGIVSEKTIQKLVSIAKEFPNDPKKRLQLFCEVLSSLPMTNRITLIYFLDFLHNLTRKEEVNKMNAKNIAIAIGPSVFCLLGTSQKSKEKQDAANAVLAQLIEDSQEIKRNFGFRFGAPIDDFKDVPRIVRQICDHIVDRSIGVKNILSIPGKKEVVKKIRGLYEKQSVVDLTVYSDPYAAPTVLKMFLRELGGGVVNEEATLSIVRIAEDFPNDPEERWKRFCDVLSRMPIKNRRLLVCLVYFLHRVFKKQKVNEMTLESIAASFGGNIFHLRDPNEAMRCQKILNGVLAQLVQDPQKLKILERRTEEGLNSRNEDAVTHTQAANVTPMQSLQQVQG